MSRFTKLIYIVLFIGLVIHPHFVTGHVFSVSQAYAQTLITLLIVFTGIMVYVLHKRDIAKRDLEKKEIESKFEVSSKNLNDSFKYIGLMNRRLPLLPRMTTGLIVRTNQTKNGKKTVFDDLLITAAVSIAGAKFGVFRFVDTSTQRTLKEFIYTDKGNTGKIPPISNSGLISNSGFEATRKNSKNYIFKTSDKKASIKCFMILSKEKQGSNGESSVLQAICDQAQLLYKYLY